MDDLKKALGNAPVFVGAYIIFMLPTYLLPYLGSNSLLARGFGAAAGVRIIHFPFWLHLAAMGVLCFLCWVRGAYVDKKWLIVFPVLAIVFDFVPGLSAIPLIPTLMHLLAIILGVVGATAVIAQPALAGGSPAGQAPGAASVAPLPEAAPWLGAACAQCGSGTRDKDKFCSNCGAAQIAPEPVMPVACTACETPRVPDGKYCINCGLGFVAVPAC